MLILWALLVWDANTEGDLSHYTVYKLDAVFGWYPIDEVGEPECELDSYGVYCVTASDTSLNESEYSEPIMYDYVEQIAEPVADTVETTRGKGLKKGHYKKRRK